MGDFLLFVARLAAAQHDQLQRFPDVPLPDVDALERAARAACPPLPATDHPRDPAWRGVARAIAGTLADGAQPALAPALARVAEADDDWLERQADCLLTNVMHGLDLATAPVVAGALQVYFAHLVIATQQRYAGRFAGGFSLPFGRTADATLCPCCGSRPVAGVTRVEAAIAGQRYLACGLCASQWHMVRIQCSHCLSSQAIAYEALRPQGDDDDGRAAQATVQAEVCDDCGHYLKLIHMDRDPNVDPVADDLASVTLDLLVAEGGRQRHGVNLMLLFGDPDAPAGTHGADEAPGGHGPPPDGD